MTNLTTSGFTDPYEDEKKAKAQEDARRLINKFKKGFRAVKCPKCGQVFTGKYLVEIERCGCGYVKGQPFTPKEEE